MKAGRFKYTFRAVAYLLLSLISGSCEKSPLPDCFKSTGKVERETRDLEYFHGLKLYDNINLQLIPAAETSLTLEAGRNLLGKIDTYVNEDSILIIRNNNTCNWVRSYEKPINVYLRVRDLQTIEYRSIGDLSCSDTLRQDSLRIDVWEGAGTIDLGVNLKKCEANIHYGTAVIELSGITRQGYYYQLGAGQINASGLRAEQVYIRNWSSNDLFSWATKYLSAEIKGLGNVYYRGNPVISSSLQGQGKLLQMP
jgi:hypothetical protein